MISRLRGILESKKPPFLLIDVNGIGYELQAPLSTIYQLPEVGGPPVTLLTHLHIREDAQILYGFIEERERTLFRALIKISGVGPKMALSILSSMNPSDFIFCIEKRDTTPLVQIPGIGKKTAERLLVEMAGKLQDVDGMNEPFVAKLWEKSIDRHDSSSEMRDAISALITLGYKPQEASRAVNSIKEDTLQSQELIRRALQGLAKV